MKSKYNICKKIGNKGYLVFNTLHQNLMFINKKDFADFENENKANPNYPEWLDEGLLGENLVDEYLQKYQQIFTKNNKKRQILTIFTTTACNARCFYCFEKGIQTLSINPKEIDNLSQAIIKSINAEWLHITWFGGEPLLFANAIDQLTENIKTYCDNNNIKYTASIITNGSLINDDIKQKMHSKWNIVSTQITLDGLEKKYNKIKAYVDGSDFKKVVQNIKLISSPEYKTTIRINFDKHNLNNCLKLVKYLYKNGLTNDKVFIYFSPITTNKGNDKSKKLINNQFKKIFKVLFKYGYIKGLQYFNFYLAEHHCQAEQPNSYCLFPNGTLTKCQRQKPQSSNISIYDEGFLQKLNAAWNSFEVSKQDEKCNDCKMMPLCRGGCKINDFTKLTKNHCDRCYVYSDAFDAILDILAKIYLK